MKSRLNLLRGPIIPKVKYTTIVKAAKNRSIPTPNLLPVQTPM